MGGARATTKYAAPSSSREKWLRRVVVGFLALHAAELLLRPLHDRLGANADLDRVLPGDDVVVHVDNVITRAILIHAAPSDIWPWLVQMGWGRAGWYSYDWIDNRGRASATSLLPQFQNLQPGDVMPSGPGGVGFRVRSLVANEHLLLEPPGVGAVGTWCFYLQPVDEGQTRLIERIRSRTSWWSPSRWLQAPADLLDLVMMRRHMKGLKARAEARP